MKRESKRTKVPFRGNENMKPRFFFGGWRFPCWKPISYFLAWNFMVRRTRHRMAISWNQLNVCLSFDFIIFWNSFYFEGLYIIWPGPGLGEEYQFPCCCCCTLTPCSKSFWISRNIYDTPGMHPKAVASAMHSAYRSDAGAHRIFKRPIINYMCCFAFTQQIRKQIHTYLFKFFRYGILLFLFLFFYLFCSICFQSIAILWGLWS